MCVHVKVNAILFYCDVYVYMASGYIVLLPVFFQRTTYNNMYYMVHYVVLKNINITFILKGRVMSYTY